MYLEVKTFHLATVGFSISLYLVRFLRYYATPEVQEQPRWVKYLPHLNDTLLLCSGFALISITKFIPFTTAAPWLSYKLGAIVLYIACGFGAMNRKANRRKRIMFFIASIGWLFVVIILALTKRTDAVFEIFKTIFGS